MNYLELKDNRVVNVIVWDGVSPYNPPGIELVACVDAPGVGPGWTRNPDGTWTEPEIVDDITPI